MKHGTPRDKSAIPTTGRNDSLKKALTLPVDGFDKLLQASTGKNGYMVMPLELGRGNSCFNKF